MLRKGQEGHVRAERDVLKSASLVNSTGGAEWIVRLYYSFQDRDNLYLVSNQPVFRKLTAPYRFTVCYLINQFISLGTGIHGWWRPLEFIDTVVPATLFRNSARQCWRAGCSGKTRFISEPQMFKSHSKTVFN